jgi:MscS family membrane protein
MPRLVLVGVALALALASYAQSPPTTVTTSTLAAEAQRPAHELGPDTPRGAMFRFLDAAHHGRYALAAEYLNTRHLPSATRAAKGAELARELDAVLDRALVLHLNQVSQDPEGDPDDGLPPLRDSLGTVETANGPIEILIERVTQPSGTPVWKIAAATVAAIPTLYDEYGWGPLGSILPAPFFEFRFLRVRLWQWIGFVLLFAFAWLASVILRRLTLAVARRLVAGLDPRFAEEAVAPLQLAIAVAIFAAGLRLLALALAVERFFHGVLWALVIVVITWLLLRMVDVVARRIERQLDPYRRAREIMPLGRRSLKVFVALLAFIAALQNFGFNVTGLLAGLGVGGLAIALAAQKTVENLFGSISLIADQPVRVGDVCRFGDMVGTVEDIGLRSTRLRTVDRTLVTIPNAQFSTLALENLSRRDRIPVRATLTLPQGTSGERVRAVLAELHAMLVAQPKVDQSSVSARFVRMGTQALEIEIFAYVLTRQWDEFVDIREQILLHALDVVGAGVSLR